MSLTKDYPRDLIGYGRRRPEVWWPDQSKVAVQFVINYEEGGENCLLHGDGQSEAFLSDITTAQPLIGQRNMNMESMYEYGSRAGFWRLYELFTSRGLPVTIFGVASAMQRNPDAVNAMLDANWEIASHGLRWIDYQNVSIEDERAHVEQAIAIQKAMTGQGPQGWYTGRTSPNTRAIVLEQEGILYDSDSYADDLPYWQPRALMPNRTKPHLVIPYTLDANDMRFSTPSGFTHGGPFFEYLRDTFDVLYEEGKTAPKMMTVGLHPRLIGRPGRLAGLKRFLDHIQSHDKVWVCRRIDIAQHWYSEFPDEQGD